MQKCFLILLSIALLLLVSACQEEQVNRKFSENMNLESFIQSVALPENLTISFDPSEVRSISSAKTYTTKFLELDPDLVSKELLRGEIVEKMNYAEGPSIHAGDELFKEYLTVYDGGKSAGIDSGVNGGLSYIVDVNGSFNRPDIISTNVGPPDISEQLRRSLRRSDYASSTDLSFSNYADALDSVKEKLHKIGVPDFELAESYSLDLETIQEHYAAYLKENQNSDEIQEYTWTMNDEQYLFHFRQVIDSIPIINISWQWGQSITTNAVGYPMRETTVSATYTKDGIISIYASNLFDVSIAKVGEETSLLGAAEALQVLLSDYEDLILEEGTTVTSTELVYVSIPEKDMYKLIPAWVFHIAKPQVWTGDNGDKGTPFNEYSQFVVDATTGHRISSLR